MTLPATPLIHDETFATVEAVFDRTALLVGLKTVSGAIDTNPSVPLLSHVLIEAYDSRAILTGCDLETELKTRVDVDVVEAGRFAIPGKKFTDIIKALPTDAKVRIRVDGNKAKITAGRSRFSVQTLTADAYPGLALHDSQVLHSVTIAGPHLARAMDETQHAMAVNDLRYYLNGLLLETDARSFRAVATDGHRLSMVETPLTHTAGESASLILPRKGALEIARVIRGFEGMVSLELGQSGLKAKIADTEVSCKALEGKFPNYRRVIPQQAGEGVEVHSQLLAQAVKRTALLAGDKVRTLRMGIDAEELSLRAHNTQQDEAEETLAVNNPGKAATFGMNADYLLDVLSVIESDIVRIWPDGQGGAMVLRNAHDEGPVFVIMPARL